MKNINKIKHKFYLVYSRTDSMLKHKRQRYLNRTDVINNHPYCVHFDIYSLKTNNSIEELGSWHYPIYFDYLPAFRMVLILRFPLWFKNIIHDPCLENMCNENSTCKPIFNRNNSYYCSCNSSYYGKDCQIYEHRCDTYCSSIAGCQHNNYYLNTSKNNLYCICSLDSFGPNCNLNYDGCTTDPCLNNRSCFSSYDKSGETSYICICSELFYGKLCQLEKVNTRISLNHLRTLFVHATLVQFSTADSHNPSKLFVEYQQVFEGLPLVIKYNHIHSKTKLGIVKIYQDSNIYPNYLVYPELTWRRISGTSFPRHCPYVSSLLSKGELVLECSKQTKQQVTLVAATRLTLDWI
jgi:hypothetical protein